MERPEHDAPDQATVDTKPAHGERSVAPSEFICPGCGRPLAIALHSTMCFAEALVYCPDCERDYRQRRGQWAVDEGDQRPRKW